MHMLPYAREHLWQMHLPFRRLPQRLGLLHEQMHQDSVSGSFRLPEEPRPTQLQLRQASRMQTSPYTRFLRQYLQMPPELSPQQEQMHPLWRQ